MRTFSSLRAIGLVGVLGIGAALVARKNCAGGRAARRTASGSWLDWFVAEAAQALDRSIGWDRLPVPLGLFTVLGLRIRLRKQNLYDTGVVAAVEHDVAGTMARDARYLTARTADGTLNDLAQPLMGSAGVRFGRNVPRERTYPECEPAILEPNPRDVSRELLTRDAFTPVPHLNLLIASWIQFMVRDWFSHGTSPKENPWLLPLRDDDPWPEHPMRIMRVPTDPTRAPGSSDPPTFINTETHWWDASQIYGSNQAYQDSVRSGTDGKLRIGADGLPPIDPFSSEHPSQVPGFWVGLAMMQSLFMREHNAVCDRLRAAYPTWSDDDLFDHARLVVAALLAKIHTVEWTPAIISHPTTKAALRTNWWGLQGERLTRLFGRGDNEVISGIIGSHVDHFGVPYTLTEEFTAVYRMHPLIPDDLAFRSAANDEILQKRAFPQVAGPHALELMDQVTMTDLFYSFGVAHPGAVELHNYPRSLQHFERPDGNVQDLAATDILRMRELGVPRYNEFRRLMHKAPVRSFEELTGNHPVWTDQMRRVYGGDIERVDLMVGMFAEPKPEGFGFSDTAFRIFILMASRRLNSDRFLTVDYTPQVYTQTGLDWIADNTMVTVLQRHFPALAPSLRGVTNAFAPWGRTAA